MKVLRITNGFNEMTDAYLMVRADFIRAAMTGNPSFPSPDPSLIAVSNATIALRQAVEKAESGNRQDIAVKNERRESLINLLHLLGAYVLFTSGGNEVVATSSGFHVAKTAAPLPPMIKPEGLLLFEGDNKGELKAKFNRVRGARAYLYEITPSPVTVESRWESSLSTVTGKTFTGLESGKEYNCRVAAIGKKEQVIYSGTVSRIVQ